MALFIKVFYEAVGLVIVLEGCFVFFVSRGELSTSLSNVSFVAIGNGAPPSGLIAEIFLQHLEHLHLAHLTHKHHIINYC